MLLLIAGLLLCAVPIAQAEGQSTSLHAQLGGPLVVTTESVTMYTLTMLGGPAEAGIGNYSYHAEMTGKDTYGAFFLPGTVEPTTNGVFYINLTAPSVPQTLTIDINCSSTSTTTKVYTNIEYKVVVVEPLVLSATIKNTGNVNVLGVPLTLQIYQDGEWVELYNTTLDLSAGASYDFLYNWTALGLESGKHKVRMLLDPNNDIVTFEGGASVYETTIYYKMPGYGWVNSLLWVLLVVLGVTMFFVWRRPAPRGKRKR